MKHTPRAALALTLSLAAMAGPVALAWTPALDEPTAQAIVDAAYRRGEEVATSTTLSLAVKDGAFQAGPATVSAFDGGEDCLKNWLGTPTNYAAFGSRPASLTVAGQGYYASVAAQLARDGFKSATAKEAIEGATRTLPAGQLRVFVKIEGLVRQELRDAYLVVAQDKDGAIVQPVRTSFVNDWKAAGEGPAALWSGTMIYNFDFSKGNVNPVGPLALLFRTEARNTCAYRVNVNLAEFR